MRWVALLAAATVLAGCAAGPAQVTCQVPEAPRVATPDLDSLFMATDPAQPWDALVLRSDAPLGDTAWVAESPQSWRVEESDVGNGSGLVRLRVQPSGDVERGANVTMRWSTTAADEACAGGHTGSLWWHLAAPVAGDVARPGMGVRVLTAGFYENGTLFYTNIAAIDGNASWPRASWYAWEGGAPLPVYVYDQDRAERGPIWSVGTAGTPLEGPTGGAQAWSYYTTIPGFNGALKGLSAGTTRVVHLRPEEGYTRAGNEAHPLYGASLVFLIKVVSVDPMPCADMPRVCVPNLAP